jgi:hypothetical protein
MNLTFVCQNCDDSFELDFNAFVEDPKGQRCPNCNKKFPAAEMDELATTLDDLLGQVAALRKRVLVSFDVDAEDLPPPYDVDGKKAASSGDDEDEDEDEGDDDVLGDDEPADDDDRY